jgi:hypothetical protein
MGETMQPDPDRYDDDPEEQADELTEADDESATGFKSLGGELGRAMGNLERTLTEKGVITSGAQSRAQEDEPPFALPLIDEEELAAIKDPTERARSRRNRIELYKNHPDALAHYMERSEQLKAERNKVVMLTPWSDDRRAAPNAVFRSALFPALNNKKSRRFVQNHKIYSVSGLDVTFTGQQFDQTDLDVYLEILNLAKAVPLGQPVRFSAYSLLKALGWGVGGNKHKRLHLVLVRLCGGVVEATDHKARYFGQLIFGGVRDEITNDYEITINPNFAKLFGFGLWSSIDLDQRRQLERNSTAKALHAYYSTHTAPDLHRYDTLAQLAGLEGKNRRDVKASLIRAHEELKRVGFLVSYDPKPNGIEVVINMTEGQQQHLVRKVAKAAKPRKTP